MRTPKIRPEPDALTSALQDAALCLFIMLVIALGAAIDRTREAEDALQAERQRAAQAAREAFQAGLDEAAERELFRRQRQLAAMEPLT